MQEIKAPDFPTGAYLFMVMKVLRMPSITGRGKVVMRANADN